MIPIDLLKSIYESCPCRKSQIICDDCPFLHTNYPKAWTMIEDQFTDCVDRDSLIEFSKFCKNECHYHRNNLEYLTDVNLNCDCPALKTNKYYSFCGLKGLLPIYWNGILNNYG